MIARALRNARSGQGANLLVRSIVILAWVLTVALGLSLLLPPRLDVEVPAGSMHADRGRAYIAPVPSSGLPPGFHVMGDTGVRLPASILQLHENGKPLGPARTSHAVIRAEGGGRYSHWGEYLWFSASDSTDPRSNGRRYSVHATATPQLWLLLTVAALDAFAILQAWLWVSSRVLWRRRLLNGAIIAALILACLLAAGAFGRVNAAAGEPKGVTLVAATLLHALLGVALLLAQWAAGAGVARLLLGERRSGFADVLILGFAASLPVAALLALAALTLPAGLPIAIAGFLLCCLPLRRWRPADAGWASLAQVAMAMLPLALAFGCWIALLWHGPTETLGGSPSGDLVYYSTAIVSLGKQFYPYLNLGYEYQPLNHYFNMLFPLLGAAMSKAIALDPFLLVAAGGAASFVLGLGLMLHLYVRGTGILAEERSSPLASLTLLLAVLVANNYAYWTVESIPVIHAVPLIVAVVYWSRKSEAWARIAAFIIAVIGSAFSKVVGAAILAPYAAAAAFAHLFQMSRVVRIAAGVLAAAAAAYAAAMVYNLGALNFAVSPLGPMSFKTIKYYGADATMAAPLVLRDLSAAALAGVAFLLMDRLRAIAVAFGCLLVLVYPFLFFFDFVCAAIIIGLAACDDPQRLQRHRVPVLAALLLALPAVLVTDPSGVSSGLAWTVCTGGVVLIAQRRRLKLTREGWVRLAAASLVLCAGLAGVARGNVVLTSGWQPGVLTPKVREIWLAVRERTPPDALVFTDQTGPLPTLLGSWNTYAFIGARQIFVSNLYMNAATRLNRELAAEVLQQNKDVLDGRLSPGGLALRNRYAGYYAVVSCSRTVAPAWRRIFGNDAWCLYEIGVDR